MSDSHSITPPPELIAKWTDNAHLSQPNMGAICHEVATLAARWGADQELEACIQYFHEYDPSWGEDSELIAGLRITHRPKPPSLKDEVREIIECLIEGDCVNDEDAVTLRRTLEFLPN